MKSHAPNAMPTSGSRYASVAEAAAQQNPQAVVEMLSQGYKAEDQDSDGNTALHYAVWFRLDSLLTPLLERGARPDIPNNSGECAIHWAANSSNVVALDAMTRANRALLSIRDCDGFTAFLLSAQSDNSPVMEWLYLKGVSLEEQDDCGRTALLWACHKGNKKTVQWLLSRSASIAHRDREGMTALHQAALQGHTLVAEMLMEVGAVHLLDVPDSSGETPIQLAMRKGKRHLVLDFHKCQVFNFLFGRPYLFQTNYAGLFLCFVVYNIIVFAFVIAPGIVARNPEAVMIWSMLMGLSLLLWVRCLFSDPGWLQPRTIQSQTHLLGKDPAGTFDVDQPIESQMAHCDSLLQQLTCTCDGEVPQLTKLELEQNKYNYQRHLLQEARKRLKEGCGLSDPRSPALGESQPLIASSSNDGGSRQGQLDRATVALHERERAAVENLGRARVEHLLSQGSGEYLTLVEKGDFKKVCIICRAVRTFRSHHCKEQGRCVERMDHHCPWIDNSVGLGNQRSFFLFITVLLSALLYFYYTVFLYAFDTVFPEISRSSFAELLERLRSGSFGAELQALLVLVTAAFDAVWVCFVGMLVVRTTANMMVNLTAYEVLVRPSHVLRRFPKTRGEYWYLQDFGIRSAFYNSIRFWTLDDSGDAAAFRRSQEVHGKPSHFMEATSGFQIGPTGTEHCSFFTYWKDGNCYAQTDKATEMRAIDVISGPAYCGKKESLLPERAPDLPKLQTVADGHEGPKVYVYELPERFRNGGKDPTCFTADCVFGGPPMMVQGVEIWSSNQFHMPRMVYYRFLTSSRRTRDINEAEVFLVPAYSSTPSPETKCADNDDLFQTLFQLNPALQDPAWATEKASRHLFVDARGWETCNYMWQTAMPFRMFHRVTWLSQSWTEAKPFFWYQMPYPSVYHGHAEAIPAKLRRRGFARYLWSFTGTGRGIAGELRGSIKQQCSLCTRCGRVSDIPEVGGEVKQRGDDSYRYIAELKLQSTFCLEPPGDTLTRKSLLVMEGEGNSSSVLVRVQCKQGPLMLKITRRVSGDSLAASVDREALFYQRAWRELRQVGIGLLELHAVDIRPDMSAIVLEFVKDSLPWLEDCRDGHLLKHGLPDLFRSSVLKVTEEKIQAASPAVELQHARKMLEMLQLAAKPGFYEFAIDSVMLSGPETVVHMDARQGNVFFEEDKAGDDGKKRLKLFDWQNVTRGTGALDLAYTLSGSLSVSDRREWQDDLLALYRQVFCDVSGTSYPMERLRDDYRNALIWPLVWAALTLADVEATVHHCAGPMLGAGATAEDVAKRVKAREVAREFVTVGSERYLQDSMALGCIPVVFEHQELDMFEPFLSAEQFAASTLFVPETEVLGGNVTPSIWAIGTYGGKTKRSINKKMRRLQKLYPEYSALLEALHPQFSQQERWDQVKRLFPSPTPILNILTRLSEEEVRNKQEALAQLAHRLVIGLDDSSEDSVRILIDKIVTVRCPTTQLQKIWRPTARSEVLGPLASYKAVNIVFLPLQSSKKVKAAQLADDDERPEWFNTDERYTLPACGRDMVRLARVVYSQDEPRTWRGGINPLLRGAREAETKMRRGVPKGIKAIKGYLPAMLAGDAEMRTDAMRALEVCMTGKFNNTAEYRKLQRDSNVPGLQLRDSNLGIVRAAVSKSFTVVSRTRAAAPFIMVRSIRKIRSLLQFQPLRCPTSPLCLFRRLNVPTRALKLILAFDRPHRAPRAVDLPPRTELYRGVPKT
ncbi:Ankyrin-3 [Symbiodinium microadriaticum]|uniref:Ankyrin-3 n=1 Tax=Symbiodinium microadriaticum TaxID=2951 RepID=A0A1Q9E2T9_SYMMI|nr:Ankyrin-3 [Symbiodinium microadriaticum]